MRAKQRQINIPEARQLPSGSWNIQLRLGGKSISVTEPTEALARAKATAIKAGFLSKPETGKKKAAPTLGQLIDRYIDDKEAVLSPSTIRGYAIIRRNQFQQYMDTAADKINFQRMISDESKRIKPQTLRHAWALVAVSLRYAGLTVPTVTLAPIVPAERNYLNAEQMRDFISALQRRSPEVELAALLCLHGLRYSEVLNVTKADIDGGVIHVRGAAVRDRYNQIVHKDTNKNSTSRRDVPIFLPRVNVLSDASMSCDYLVSIRENSLLYTVKSICKEINAPPVGLHGLRHSFASFAMITMGIPVDAVMRLGGWKSAATLRAVYTHYATAEQKKHAERMADYFKNR